MAVTYNSKMEDSLITKIQLFLFNKAFEQNFQINNYFTEDNIKEIKKHFEDFEITNNLANLYSSKYFQLELKEKIYNIKIDNINKNMLSKTKIKKHEVFFYF